MASDEFDGKDGGGRSALSALLTEPIGRHLRGAPISIAPETTLADAVALMQKQHIGCVLVVDGDGKLTGIFSERDLLNRVVGRGVDLAKTPVRAHMTPNPETLAPEDRIAWALNRMHIGGYRHVPIVDGGGRPVGMLSVKDIVDFIVELFPAEVLNLPPDPSHEASAAGDDAGGA